MNSGSVWCLIDGRKSPLSIAHSYAPVSTGSSVKVPVKRFFSIQASARSRRVKTPPGKCLFTPLKIQIDSIVGPSIRYQGSHGPTHPSMSAGIRNAVPVGTSSTEPSLRNHTRGPIPRLTPYGRHS